MEDKLNTQENLDEELICCKYSSKKIFIVLIIVITFLGACFAPIFEKEQREKDVAHNSSSNKNSSSYKHNAHNNNSSSTYNTYGSNNNNSSYNTGQAYGKQNSYIEDILATAENYTNNGRWREGLLEYSKAAEMGSRRACNTLYIYYTLEGDVKLANYYAIKLSQATEK